MPSVVGGHCAFCGVLTAGWSTEAACIHCAVVLHLDRPRIDEEAVLGWVPEISQPALNRIMRELHCQLHRSQTGFATRPGAHYVSRALNERIGLATQILGTSRASELGQALSLLKPTGAGERHQLLAGIRIMPTGRFFVDDEDIYPSILDQWCKAADTNGVT